MVIGGPLLTALQQAVGGGALLVVLGAGAIVAVAMPSGRGDHSPSRLLWNGAPA